MRLRNSVRKVFKSQLKKQAQRCCVEVTKIMVDEINWRRKKADAVEAFFYCILYVILQIVTLPDIFFLFEQKPQTEFFIFLIYISTFFLVCKILYSKANSRNFTISRVNRAKKGFLLRTNWKVTFSTVNVFFHVSYVM